MEGEVRHASNHITQSQHVQELVNVCTQKEKKTHISNEFTAAATGLEMRGCSERRGAVIVVYHPYSYHQLPTFDREGLQAVQDKEKS